MMAARYTAEMTDSITQETTTIEATSEHELERLVDQHLQRSYPDPNLSAVNSNVIESPPTRADRQSHREDRLRKVGMSKECRVARRSPSAAVRPGRR